MAGNYIDEFLVALGWKTNESSARKAEQTAKRVTDTIEKSEKRQSDAIERTAKAKVKAERERSAAEAKAAKASEASTASIVKGAAATVAAIEAAAVGITAAIVKISSGMEALYYASQRTQSSAAKLKAFSYAASQLGSSAEGAAGSLEELARKMRSSPGYEGMLKSLGIATRQNGKMRDLTDQTIELGRALAKMPHFQALAYANAMGINERDLSALKNGEFARYMREYEEMLGKAGLDSDRAAKDSAEFMNTWRRMWAAVDILMTRIAGSMTEKFGGQIGRLTDYLLQNSDAIARAVVNIAEVLLRLATRIVDIIQAFNEADPSTKQFAIQIGALGAALLLLKSGPIAALLALGAGIVLLYEDYRKWKEGSKDTLIPWETWGPVIEKTLTALKSLWEGFDKAARAITGQSGIVVAFELLAAVMVAKLLSPLVKVVGLLGSLGAMTPPAWLLRLLGLGGVAIAGAAIANENGILDAGAGSRSWHEAIVRTLDPGIANRIYGQTEQTKAADAKDGRTLYQRIMPKALGGKDAPTSVGGGGATTGQSGSSPVEAAPSGDYGSVHTTVDGRKLHYRGATEGGKARIASWLAFFQRPLERGGMGADAGTARAMVAMMQGESDVNLNPGAIGTVGEIGTAQWYRERATALRALAEGQGKPWQDVGVQQQHWRNEALGKYNRVWRAILNAESEEEKLAIGVSRFEIPKDIPSAIRHRLVHLRRLQKAGAGNQAVAAALPEIQMPSGSGSGSGATTGDDSADYRAYRFEMERNAQNGSLPNEEENDADRYQAWRKRKGLDKVSAVVDKVRNVAIDTAGKVEDILTAYPQAWMDRAQTSMGKIGNGLGSPDAWRQGRPFSSSPLGVSQDNRRSVTNNFNEGDRHIQVQGVSDPKEAANHVESSEKRRRAELIGNFQNRFA